MQLNATIGFLGHLKMYCYGVFLLGLLRNMEIRRMEQAEQDIRYSIIY